MTLGQVLKSKRLELGKSIEQIATATRIHVKVLSAIEEDQYSDLPARAFTRGFIISYSKILQLNSDQILCEYHDFLESKFAERPEKDHGHHGYAFEGKENEQNKRWMITIASVAAFFAILTLLFFKPQNNRHKEKHKELIVEETEIAIPANIQTPTQIPTAVATTTANTATPIATKTLVTATPIAVPTATSTPTLAAATTTVASSPTPSPAATPKEDPLSKGDDILANDAGVKISIIALEDTLIRYQSDKRKPFSIRLRKDKQLVIKATDLIRVETASPDHMKYRVNFKRKAAKAYSELKEQHLELHSDGTETTFSAGAF